MSKRSKILILVIGILIIASFNFFQKELRGFFYKISAPIQKIFWQAGDKTSDFFESLFSFRRLKSENEKIRTQYQDLLAKLVELNSLKEENKNLRKALEIGLQKEFKIIDASLISKDISQEFVLIDKGLEDGLAVDMPVITSEKVICGKITEVYKNFSKVLLISSQRSSFDAKILTENKTVSALARGRGGGKIYLDLIPQEEKIKEEDVVITSSLGKMFPENLLVGSIGRIKKSDVKPFQQAEIYPFCRIEEIEDLFVVLETFSSPK